LVGVDEACDVEERTGLLVPIPTLPVVNIVAATFPLPLNNWVLVVGFAAPIAKISSAVS
jgi:hypothetical protein